VDMIEWRHGRPSVKTKKREFQEYDLLVVATGLNSGSHKLFTGNEHGYEPPGITKTVIREYKLGEAVIEKYLGNSMHVFLLDVPRLEFAALIPKGDYVTVCMLGEDIDSALVESFLQRREVLDCMPPGWDWQQKACLCAPKMYLQAARRPFADRLVFIGDSGVARLYKDGIGSAYRTAKAAATAAALHGISEADFERHFWPICRTIERDNRLGRFVFAMTDLLQKWTFSRRAVLSMVRSEQSVDGRNRLMSQILWDTFTGSARYRDIFLRTVWPVFIGRVLRFLALSLLRPHRTDTKGQT